MIGRVCTSAPPFLALEVGEPPDPYNMSPVCNPPRHYVSVVAYTTLPGQVKDIVTELVPAAIAEDLNKTNVCVFSYFMQMCHSCIAVETKTNSNVTQTSYRPDVLTVVLLGKKLIS